MCHRMPTISGLLQFVHSLVRRPDDESAFTGVVPSPTGFARVDNSEVERLHMKIAITFLTIAALAPLASAQVAVDPCATGPASCATLIETHATSEMRLPNTAVDISVG